MSVRIIVDSTADVSASILPKLEVVPLTVHFGDEEYIDGVTIDHKTFYEKLIESDVLPTTSQATPAAFTRLYERITAEGDSAVVLTISSKLFGTYQSAVIATEDYGDQIYVVDTQSAPTRAPVPLRWSSLKSDSKEVMIWLCPRKRSALRWRC